MNTSSVISVVGDLIWFPIMIFLCLTYKCVKDYYGQVRKSKWYTGLIVLAVAGYITAYMTQDDSQVYASSYMIAMMLMATYLIAALVDKEENKEQIKFGFLKKTTWIALTAAIVTACVGFGLRYIPWLLQLQSAVAISMVAEIAWILAVALFLFRCFEKRKILSDSFFYYPIVIGIFSYGISLLARITLQDYPGHVASTVLDVFSPLFLIAFIVYFVANIENKKHERLQDWVLGIFFWAGFGCFFAEIILHSILLWK